MSTRTQRVLLGWGLAGAVVWFVDLLFLLHMFPPPPATWTPAQVAHFYAQHSTEIKVGATLSSWVAGFFVPLATEPGRGQNHQRQAACRAAGNYSCGWERGFSVDL